MPRLSFNDAEKYQGNSYYFSLADDGDYADVTVLANTIEDIPIYAVHRLDFGKYSVSVNCLRQPDEPASVCPLCAAGNHNPRVVIELVLLTSSGIKVFERGKKFMPKLQRWGRQYPLLCQPVLQVVRVGKSGDQATTYDFEKVGDNGSIQDWRELADENEVQAILSTIIKDWSLNDMDTYLRTGRDPFGSSKSSADGNEAFRPRGNVTAQRPQARPVQPARQVQRPVPAQDDVEDYYEDEAPQPQARQVRQAPPVRQPQARQVPRQTQDFEDEGF